MTTEILIEKVREELGTLDVPVEQAIAAAIKIMQRVKTAPTPQPSEANLLRCNPASGKQTMGGRDEMCHTASFNQSVDPLNALTQKRPIYAGNKRRKRRKMLLAKIAAIQSLSQTE